MSRTPFEVEDKIQNMLTNDDNIIINNNYQYEDHDIQAILTSRLWQTFNIHGSTIPIDVLAAADDIIGNQIEQRLQQEKNSTKGHRIILLPCNLGNYHWVGILAEIELNGVAHRIEYIDSLHNVANDNIPQKVITQVTAVYPDHNLRQLYLLKQNDPSSCGVYTIENLLLAAQKPKTLPANLSSIDIRHIHLECLKKYREDFYQSFYERQRDNKPTILALPEQLGYLKRLAKPPLFSKPEMDRILEVKNCLQKISDQTLKDELWQAFQPKVEYKDNINSHLNTIRQTLQNTLTVINEKKLSEDQKLFQTLISLLFKPTSQTGTPSDINLSAFCLEYGEILAITTQSELTAETITECAEKPAQQIEQEQTVATPIKITKEEVFLIHNETTQTLSKDSNQRDRLLGVPTIEQHLTTAEQSFISGDYKNAEDHYAKAAHIAKANDNYNILMQIFCKMGEIYICYAQASTKEMSVFDKQYSLVKATALYNCAINVETEKLKTQETFNTSRAKLTEIETIFLTLCGKTVNSHPFAKVNQEHRDYLSNVRNTAQRRLSSINWQAGIGVEDLYKDITSSMQKFVIKLWQECIETIGKPPCKYAMIAFGSMAHGEMTPYSDFEWGILLESSTEEIKEYFKTLANLLYLKVVNLGETILPIMGIKSLQGIDDYITPRGFTFDGQVSRASKTPFGKPNMFVLDKSEDEPGFKVNDGYRVPGYELLGTPAEVAELQKETWFRRDPLLPIEVYQFVFVTGDQTLAKAYQQLTNNILDAEDTELSEDMVMQQAMAMSMGQEPLSPTLRQSRALKLLKQDDADFRFDLYSPTESGKLYQVKRHLYRLLNTLLDDLGLFYKIQIDNLEINSGWKKIDLMVEKGLLNKEGALNIKQALSIIVALRLHTYIANGGQRENMLARALNVQSQTTIDSINQIFFLHDPQCLMTIYKIIIPLQEQCQNFSYDNYNDPSYWQKTFLDETDDTIGNIHRCLMQYSQAVACFNKAIISKTKLYGTREHLEVIKTLDYLASVYNILGHADEQEKISLEILTTMTKCYTRKHPFVISSLNQLALAYRNQGLIYKEKEVLDEALAIENELYKGQDNTIIAATLHDLANVYGELGYPLEKKNLLERALSIEIKYYKDIQHIALTRTLIDLSLAYGETGDSYKRRELLERILIIQTKYFGTRHHIEIAPTLNNLAKTYGEFNDPRELQLLEETLAIQMEHYGTREHINISSTLYNMAFAYEHLGNIHQKRQLLEESLAIRITLFHHRDPLHPSLAIPLFNLAHLHKTENNLFLAFELIDYACRILFIHQSISKNLFILKNSLLFREQIKQAILITKISTWTPFNQEEFLQAQKDMKILLALGYYYLVQEENTNNAILHLEKAISLAPRHTLPKAAHNLACCYHVRRKTGDFILAIKNFEYAEAALKLTPSANIYCEYGHFLYQNFTKPSVCDTWLKAAINKLKQAVAIKQDQDILSYSITDKPVIEEYLQELIDKHGRIVIKASCLAYYLLIKSYHLLNLNEAAEQALEDFDVHVTCLLSVSIDADNSLKTEQLLLERAKQLMPEEPLTIQINNSPHVNSEEHNGVYSPTDSMLTIAPSTLKVCVTQTASAVIQKSQSKGLDDSSQITPIVNEDNDQVLKSSTATISSNICEEDFLNENIKFNWQEVKNNIGITDDKKLPFESDPTFFDQFKIIKHTQEQAASLLLLRLTLNLEDWKKFVTLVYATIDKETPVASKSIKQIFGNSVYVLENTYFKQHNDELAIKIQTLQTKDLPEHELKITAINELYFEYQEQTAICNSQISSLSDQVITLNRRLNEEPAETKSQLEKVLFQWAELQNKKHHLQIMTNIFAIKAYNGDQQSDVIKKPRRDMPINATKLDIMNYCLQQIGFRLLYSRKLRNENTCEELIALTVAEHGKKILDSFMGCLQQINMKDGPSLEDLRREAMFSAQNYANFTNLEYLLLHSEMAIAQINTNTVSEKDKLTRCAELLATRPIRIEQELELFLSIASKIISSTYAAKLTKQTSMLPLVSSQQKTANIVEKTLPIASVMPQSISSTIEKKLIIEPATKQLKEDFALIQVELEKTLLLNKQLKDEQAAKEKAQLQLIENARLTANEVVALKRQMGQILYSVQQQSVQDSFAKTMQDLLFTAPEQLPAPQHLTEIKSTI